MAKSFIGSTAESISPLMLRLPLGIIFLAHGSQKLFGLFGGEGVTATMKMFESHLGIPPIFTILAMLAEFGGGLGILLGCMTRLSAFGIAAVMAAAIYKVHWANGFFLATGGRQAGSGIEFNIALLGMALSLILCGGGRWALDRLIWKR